MELFEYIVCKSCGKRVVKNSATQKYCSYACDYKAKRKRLLEDRKNNPQKYKDRDKRYKKKYGNNKECIIRFKELEKNRARKHKGYSNIHKIKSIKKVKEEDVYDIINVENNNNYIANNFIVHNSSEDWAKKSHKELKKKLAQVRTKHLLYILCFPLKIQKLEKTYLESFTNYWISLFDRGIGALYVKDNNPVNDTWRMSDFKNIGSYTEFTSTNQIASKLKKHPNFWNIIKFPKPPRWLYERYLKVRETNVYDDNSLLKNTSKEDIHKSLLILALRDIMTHDTTVTMNRIILHIKGEYDLPITKGMVQSVIEDSRQLVNKIRDSSISIEDKEEDGKEKSKSL